MDRRLDRYGTLSRALAAVPSADLRRLLDRAPVVSEGIGGRAVVIELEGVPVFVKQVPLTDLERRPENIGSTANLFGLPVFYQYGVGSAGFGVWRELAALSAVSGWVIAGEATSFPMLYGSRILPGAGQPATVETIERTVDFWAASPAVRTRLRQLSGATSVVALFMEHFPESLRSYSGGGGEKRMLEAFVDGDLALMNSRGLLHLDSHPSNLMTDGEQLVLVDFGLAVSSGFDLTDEERDFFNDLQGHDRAFTLALIEDSPLRPLIVDFYQRLQRDVAHTPYPRAAIDRALAALT